jgi:uroporphyrinogen-III synthase
MTSPHKIRILSTRPVDAGFQDADCHLEIDCISFIEVQKHIDALIERRINELLSEKIVAVFTSMNALNSVRHLLEVQVDWQVFVVGETSTEIAKRIFTPQKIIGTAADASQLADLIISTVEPQQIVFFCGDKRLEHLPSKLKASDFDVEELKVYHTTETPQVVSKDYNGIVFFSPSAVKSFFKLNKLPSATVLFAIGKTTAEAIKRYSNNEVVVADKPGKTGLMKLAIQHLQSKLASST